jgi:hypothetical protein
MSAFAPFLLVVGLAGCAGQIVPCPGIVEHVEVSVERGDGGRALPPGIRDLLEVRVGCLDARYDPVTEQGRWSYWVELNNTHPKDRMPTYEFHLTQLDRKVTNYLDRTHGRYEASMVTLQEYKLDVLRAALRIPPGALTFPCAETLSAPGRFTGRARSGVYTVQRTYTGDVTIKGRDPDDIQFVPVRVAFEVGFVLPGPAEKLASDQEREEARRLLEWVRVTDRCETCRPLIICESLGQPVSLELDPSPSAEPPPYHTSNTSHVHVMAGLEKRPVIVNPTLAERKRTVACTRWSPVEGTPGDSFLWPPTDRTDDGLASATPYLTFHQSVPVTKLTPGSWKVELLLGEILDEWADLTPVGSLPDSQRRARQQELLDACLQEEPVFQQIIRVP